MTKNKNSLTSKQEKFALLVFKGNGLTDSYRAVYPCANRKPETVNRNAKTLSDNGKIVARLAELNAKAETKAIATRDRLLEIATEIAEGNGEDAKDNDRLKACEVIAKMQGYNNPEKLVIEDKRIRRTPDEMRQIIIREVRMNEIVLTDTTKKAKGGRA